MKFFIISYENVNSDLRHINSLMLNNQWYKPTYRVSGRKPRPFSVKLIECYRTYHKYEFPIGKLHMKDPSITQVGNSCILWSGLYIFLLLNSSSSRRLWDLRNPFWPLVISTPVFLFQDLCWICSGLVQCLWQTVPLYSASQWSSEKEQMFRDIHCWYTRSRKTPEQEAPVGHIILKKWLDYFLQLV